MEIFDSCFFDGIGEPVTRRERRARRIANHRASSVRTFLEFRQRLYGHAIQSNVPTLAVLAALHAEESSKQINIFPIEPGHF